MDSIVTKNYSTDEGNTWVIGGKLIVEEGAEVEGLSGGGGEGYTLPNATATKLGGVKVGNGLNVSNGLLSVAPATADTIGGVKVGTGLSITAGKLSVEAAGAESIGGVKLAENQADSTATALAQLVTDFNALLAKLKAAGIMAAGT